MIVSCIARRSFEPIGRCRSRARQYDCGAAGIEAEPRGAHAAANAGFGINTGAAHGFMRLFMSHPPLDERIGHYNRGVSESLASHSPICSISGKLDDSRK